MMKSLKPSAFKKIHAHTKNTAGQQNLTIISMLLASVVFIVQQQVFLTIALIM